PLHASPGRPSSVCLPIPDRLLARAEAYDQEAEHAKAELDQLEFRRNCDMLWMDYDSGRLKEEPGCVGHSPSLGEISESAKVAIEFIADKSEYSFAAEMERKYAAYRTAQTRYLLAC